jgi:hypothetical protein
MHLVKHQEGELQQQLAGTMDESLQEDTVRHINDFGVAVETAVHTDLVPHLALLVDLLRQDLGQVIAASLLGSTTRTLPLLFEAFKY